MNQVNDDIWNLHSQGHVIAITTNGYIKKDGTAVMGRGVALQAATRFPELTQRLGKELAENGNIPVYFEDLKIVTFPVKHNWYEKASLELIEESILKLKRLVEEKNISHVYTVVPGIGNGGRTWEEVYPILKIHLDDRFTIVRI